MVAAFHFINRIADLLHVDPEALPERLRRFEPLRRLSVWAASRLMKRMDLRNRPHVTDFDEAVAGLMPFLGGRSPSDAHAALGPLVARPRAVEVLRHALAERDERSSLPRETIARVHRAVEAALPRSPADMEGFHERPEDSVEAFAFVGTRYAHRTTESMIEALRGEGYDDVAILDLAIAVADANQWARTHRLLGLPADLFYLASCMSPLA